MPPHPLAGVLHPLYYTSMSIVSSNQVHTGTPFQVPRSAPPLHVVSASDLPIIGCLLFPEQNLQAESWIETRIKYLIISALC